MITKADIVDSVFNYYSDETLMTKRQIAAAFDGILQTIKACVANGNAIQIRGFATILPVTKKAKKAHDFKNGTTITVPEQRGVKFKVSSEFIEFVNLIEGKSRGQKDI